MADFKRFNDGHRDGNSINPYFINHTRIRNWFRRKFLMLLVKLKLQQFMNEYELKLRKPIGEDFDDKKAFSELKEELTKHLKSIDENLSLEVFKDFKIYLEGYSLCFSYKETTENNMVIRLVRRVNELTPKDIKEYVYAFIKEDLGGDVFPMITFPRNFTYQHLAMYWVDDRIIAVGNHMYKQLDEEKVKSILRHEAIHHFLSVKGKPSNDTDADFMGLVVLHDAFVSQDPSAQEAMKKFKKTKRYKNLIKEKEQGA